MKATGIVRRIDDLGRVVIPKEIRRTMRIREGDPLEIYTAGDGEVIFKKYSPIGELAPIAVQYAEAMIKHTSCPVIICDRDHCIAAAGITRREVLERRVSPELEEMVDSRASFFKGTSQGSSPIVLEGFDRVASVVVPILSAGDLVGSVIMLTPENGADPTDTDTSLAKVAAAFLGKQMEE
ncbi:MAG: AbrB/MazE/SpoVT family DNA-binding domain-containing protein [Clostridia bacterium]|nr:AbrB/MazE/SpoVT family DNA-binding domain-containing protein [Clostridia bacterium]